MCANDYSNTVPWLQRRGQNRSTRKSPGIVHTVEGLFHLLGLPYIWNSGRLCSKTHIFLILSSNVKFMLSYLCLSYRFISWWWRIQLFSRSCMWRNCSELVFGPAASRTWASPPQSCSDMPCVCLISSSASLSFSSWLPATHTSVAKRLWKPKNKLTTKQVAKTCGSDWI
jgi:hypothetical protein